MTLPLEIPVPPQPPEPPIRYLAERAMVGMLARRYTDVAATGAHRYAFADHVPDRPVFASRIADFIAMDCWGSGGFALHGHEIKASRADWLAELKNPDKAEAFKPYMDRWWLVVSDLRIVKDGELPDGWGLMYAAGSILRIKKHAPLLPDPLPLPRTMMAALLRATAKSARAALDGEQ